jgi:N6-L-threonylcarbamoyladenine synthase
VRILAIETSCDETAAAIVEDGHCVLSDPIASQIDIHRKYGGVVPELASRNHIIDIIPVVDEALRLAQCGWDDVDAIAVTQGPGLVGALLVGIQVAQTLAYIHNKPIIPVHHLAGHLHAVNLHRPDEEQPSSLGSNYVALAVSGGHTAIYEHSSETGIRQVSNTRDDAAGEAFDKVARMLGLGYPGGPVVERLAKSGDPLCHKFTLPRFKDGANDFSFSGLKTAVLTKLKKRANSGQLPEGQERADLLASFQHAVITQLTDRLSKAASHADVDNIIIAGGVACNGALRAHLKSHFERQNKKLFVARPRWCTDNAAMIAGVAHTYSSDPNALNPFDPNVPIEPIAAWRLGS